MFRLPLLATIHQIDGGKPVNYVLPDGRGIRFIKNKKVRQSEPLVGRCTFSPDDLSSYAWEGIDCWT